MENLLNSLKRENKERERRLNMSDKKLLSDMTGYMKTQKICDYDVEQVRKTIIRNTLRSYNKKKKQTSYSLKGKSIKTVNVFVLLRSFFMIYHT